MKTIDEMLDIIGNQLELLDDLRNEYKQKGQKGAFVSSGTLREISAATCDLCRTAIELSRMKAFVEGGGITGLLSGFSAGL